jgi:hypothetical protein
MRDTSIPTGDAEWLFRRLPAEMRLRIPPDLRAALVEAARGRQWGSHPVDIRFSGPLLFRRFYLAVIAGPERRSPQRVAADRQAHGLVRLGNAVFVFGTVVIFYALLMLAAMVMTGISA